MFFTANAIFRKVVNCRGMKCHCSQHILLVRVIIYYLKLLHFMALAMQDIEAKPSPNFSVPLRGTYKIEYKIPV